MLSDDWFEDWFGEEYLALYTHRDELEAERVARLIESRVHLARDSRALDLACGAGRHQRELSDHWWTVGLDLSPSLLRAARTADRSAPLVRADMRTLPFRDSAFDLVVNLFTSFGYFSDDRAHKRVIEEVARVTCPGGWFVLDYLNAENVRRTLIPTDVRKVGQHTIEQERSISDDGRFVRKTITIGEYGRTFVERVRLFEPDELTAMVSSSGYAVLEVLGEYSGATLAADSSRTIVIARRQATATS